MAGLEIVNVTVERDFSLTGLFLGLSIAIVLLVIVSALSDIRYAILRKKFPGSFLVQVEVYSQLSEQIEVLNGALNNGGKYVSSLRYATVVADSNEIRLYGGVRASKLLFVLRRSLLIDVTITTAPQGKYVWESLGLVAHTEQGSLPVNLCVIRFRWGLIWEHVRGRTLTMQLAQFRAAIGPSPAPANG